MKWFGRKAGRLAARPFLLRGWSAALGELWPKSYEAQVREAYLGNPVAQRAVRLVAEGVASASLYELKEGSPSTSSGRAVALLSAPLLEIVASQLLLHGNAYLQILTDAEGEPAELFALRPERVGSRRFRLSRLLRGRRGSEWAAAMHVTGEPFVLLERDRLAPVEAPAGSIGGELKVMAAGVGDADAPPVAALTIEGRALQPPSPVHLRAEREASGDIAISWVRRSRSGWAWLSGSDTPRGEERESYRLVLSGAGFERTINISHPGYIYTAAQQAEDGWAGPLLIRVVQVGTYASSKAANLSFG
jgi:hypothetical protein